jgi:hypothetical protein
MRDPNRDPKDGPDDVPDEVADAARQEREYPPDESDEG